MHHARPRTRADEVGFTLVEILVVMFIIAALVAIGMMSVGSARKSGQLQEALATAHAYADGADAFAREHAGRYPASIGHPQDWPNAERGPSDPSLGNKVYMARVPESVQSGDVVVGSTSATRPSITYALREGGRAYRIVVRVPDRGPCAFYGGVDTPADMRTCSSR